MKRLLLPGHVLSLCLLSACTTAPVQNKPYFEQSSEADALLSTGQPRQAARLYQNLADSYPTEQNYFRLMAAQALLQSGDHTAAKTYADSIDPAQLMAQQQHQLNLLYAQISLSLGNAEQALSRLQLIHIEQLNTSDRKHYYQSLAFAYSLTGDLINSAQARIELGKLLTQSDRIDANNSAILETLSLLPRQVLILNQPPPPDILGGWMSLANLLKQQHPDNGAFSNALAEWRLSFPEHPADQTLIQSLLSQPAHSFRQPAAIAVMLPESGPYKEAAEVVREGLMAAYYAQKQDNQQPALRFYDSTRASSFTLYHRAIADGAELIIGPLIKDNIAALANTTELPIPVLSLNHIENLSHPNLFQFGLSPLDETRQITAKARQDGHRKALILTPQTDQGERIASQLSEAWQDSDGVVLESQSYDPQQFDFSVPIKALLNLDESEQRYQRLRKLLGRNIEFTPRRRHDVETIFLTAYPTVARSINPQLRFFHATDVPVYATPHIYSGIEDARRNRDLNNVTFCDIPWLFPGLYQGELSQQALRSKWQQFPEVYLRLLALGIDAYNLVAYLDQLDTTQYRGASGNLLLNNDNRITRQLVCARFVEGIAEINTPQDQAAEDLQPMIQEQKDTHDQQTDVSTVY